MALAMSYLRQFVNGIFSVCEDLDLGMGDYPVYNTQFFLLVHVVVIGDSGR